MTDRPIIFSGPMIRALLDGRKTQTRRVLEPQPQGIESMTHVHDNKWIANLGDRPVSASDREKVVAKPPRFAPGDRLYVRETWRSSATMDALSPKKMAAACLDAGYSKPWAPIEYVADGARENFAGEKPGKTRVAIHMPRHLSRLTLIVEAVKVERLTDISEADAQAEGVEPVFGTPGVPLDRHHAAFMQLWDSLHGEGATYFNPWVVAVTFRVVCVNIDDESLLAGWVAP